MKSRESYVQSMPSWLMVVIGITVSFLIAYFDYITEWQISFAIAYLLPIYFVSWHVGKKLGIAIAILSALLRFIVSMQHNAPYGSIVPIVSNVSMRLVFFTFFAYLFASLKAALLLADKRAKIDSLTLIPNRRYFQELCEREIARLARYGQPFAVGYMDIDNFKDINDARGHAVGNELLKAVAETMQKQLRPTDSAARLGGDEFAVILSETTSDGAAKLFTRLKKALDDLAISKQWPISFSIGVVTFVAAPIDVNEALKVSDALMYESKRGGKNKISFSVYEAVKGPA